jgi:imidazolonepropionase-like amidohydrolase
VAGTDRDAFETDHGIPLYGELEALVDKCGLTTGEAITAATLNGARALGVEKEFGTIEKGRVADLIVVDANPLNDIKNLRRVAYVIKGGYVHQPAGRR